MLVDMRSLEIRAMGRVILSPRPVESRIGWALIEPSARRRASRTPIRDKPI